MCKLMTCQQSMAYYNDHEINSIYVSLIIDALNYSVQVL